MRRLPVTLAVLAVVLTIAGAVTNGWLDRASVVDIGFGVAFGLVGVACAVTGAVVASRVRGNPVGWIILLLGLGVGVVLSFGAYGEVGTATERGPLPGDDVAAWVGDVGGIPIFFGLTGFLLLLFPSGRLLGPRWRWLAWGFGLIVTVATVSYGLTPGEVAEGAVNPFGVRGAAEEPIRVVTLVTDVLAVPGMVVCAAAVVLRLHRSRGIERQQLKGFAFVAAVAGVGLGATVITRGIVSEVAFGAGLLGVAALPVTAGLAILRHGLYDIDVVIKRTLVYAPLAGALVGTYLVLVLGLQAVLPVQGESDLAVAGSTLAVAALFRPLRDRIRAVVDRRFYRSRYDAALTLETFGARLRHQVDLEVLGGDLRAVVHDTMQPAHVTLWLRGTP
jgi:hypothetical protein